MVLTDIELSCIVKSHHLNLLNNFKTSIALLCLSSLEANWGHHRFYFSYTFFSSSVELHVGSSPDLQVFSKTPNRFVPVTAWRCGRRETGQWPGKVAARPAQKHRQRISEHTQHKEGTLGWLEQSVYLEKCGGWKIELLRDTFPGNCSDDQGRGKKLPFLFFFFWPEIKWNSPLSAMMSSLGF